MWPRSSIPRVISMFRETTRRFHSNDSLGSLAVADEALQQHDRFLIEQLVRPIVNLYRITPLAAGETPAGPPVAFVRQKRMAFREDIRFFADESESEELFRIKARSMLDIGGARYDVVAADGTPIGRLEHVFGKSLLRSTWRLVGADD